MSSPDETTGLLPKKKRSTVLKVTVHDDKGNTAIHFDADTANVHTSSDATQVIRVRRKSLVARAEEADATFSKRKKDRKSVSFSVNKSGETMDLSPVEMARQELYESIPYTAVFGMQKKERNLSLAYANFAAELDVLEADALTVESTGKHLSPEEKAKRKSRASELMMEKLEADSVAVTGPLVFAVIGACLAMFNYGYNVANMNAVAPLVFPGHSTTSWALAVSAFCIGGPFGAILGGPLADKSGRRHALLVATWAYLIGGVIMACAFNINVVILGRLVIGFACGASSVVVPVYLGELAPPTLRGVFGTLTQLSLVIGILVADVFNYTLVAIIGWRGVFLMSSVFALCVLLISRWLLESPRWILGHNPDSGKARFIIKAIRGYQSVSQIEEEVDHFVASSKSHKVASDVEDHTLSNNAIAEMFRDPTTRFLLFCATFLNMAFQFCGISAVFYYSGMFFKGVINDPGLADILVATINVVATYGALLLMDSYGRRQLLMLSSGGMCLCSVGLICALLGYVSNQMALVAILGFVTFFEFGMGSIPFLIIPELFDSKYVTSAMSIASLVNWICNFGVGMGFPYINEALGPYSFAPFAAFSLLTFFFALLLLPETAGTSPEELFQMIAKKNEGTSFYNMDIEAILDEEE